MLTCLEGRRSCCARYSTIARRVCTARKASPTKWSACMTPNQINGNFCRASVRAFAEDRIRVYRFSDSHSHRTETSHWFSIDSPSRVILQLKFFPLHNTAGFSSAFSPDYAVRVIGKHITRLFLHEPGVVRVLCQVGLLRLRFLFLLISGLWELSKFQLWGAENSIISRHSLRITPDDDLFNCKSIFIIFWTYQFISLQLLLSILIAARLGE